MTETKPSLAEREAFEKWWESFRAGRIGGPEETAWIAWQAATGILRDPLLAPSPCGVDGHRMADWAIVKSGPPEKGIAEHEDGTRQEIIKQGIRGICRACEREKPTILIGMPTIERLNRGEAVELEHATLLHADNMQGALERREKLAVAAAYEKAAQVCKQVMYGDETPEERPLCAEEICAKRIRALTPADAQAFDWKTVKTPNLDKLIADAKQAGADECNAQHAAMHEQIEQSFAQEKAEAVASEREKLREALVDIGEYQHSSGCHQTYAEGHPKTFTKCGAKVCAMVNAALAALPEQPKQSAESEKGQ